MLQNTTVIGMLIRLIEGFAQVYLLSSILKKKIKAREYVLSTILVVFLYQIFSPIVQTNYIVKLLTTFTIMVGVITVVCKINIYKVFLGYTLTTVIIVLLDMISRIILLYFFEVEKLQNIGTYQYYLGMAVVNLLIFISALTIKYFKMTFANVENETKDVGIAFNTLLTLLFVFPSLLIILSHIENKPLSMANIIITIISMLAILVLSTFNSQKRYNLIISEKNLEYEKNHNVILQSLVDSLRTFKHDYNNTLSTLYGYVQLGDMKSLKRMFKEILEESRQITSLDKLNPNLIKDPNIFGLLTAKYQECIKKNIAINFEIFGEIEGIEIKTYDLTRMLGIFLDNAIEATSESKEKKLNLIINENKEKIIIEINNTYKDKEISIEKIYEKGESSKGEGRGLGLYKVKEILKRYPNIELKTVAEDEVFTQKLIIDKCVEPIGINN